MTTPLRGFVVVAAALPGLALGWFALPHFQNGLSLDAAIPVPAYMIKRAPMPVAAYANAARTLRSANFQDGDAQVAAAEASIHAGAPLRSQIGSLEQGVRDAPAAPRGWTLLSESLRPVDRQLAASSLAQALVLAPYDYWLAGSRTEDAAAQWDDLDSDTRAMALRQTQLLWDEEALRANLLALMSSNAGARLVARAFASRPNDLRALNRWVSSERRRAAQEP